VTPDTGAQPGELSPADGSGPHELLRYRSPQGRWEVAAIILGSRLARDRFHGGRRRAASNRTEPETVGWIRVHQSFGLLCDNARDA
jgi:hypothetical protein